MSSWLYRYNMRVGVTMRRLWQFVSVCLDAHICLYLYLCLPLHLSDCASVVCLSLTYLTPAPVQLFLLRQTSGTEYYMALCSAKASLCFADFEGMLKLQMASSQVESQACFSTNRLPIHPSSALLFAGSSLHFFTT